LDGKFRSGMCRPRACLLMRGGAIGDAVLTLPAVRALRNHWRGTRFCLAGYPHVCPLFAEAGLVNEFVSLDTARFARLFAAAPAWDAEDAAFFGQFDLIVSWLLDEEGLTAANLACVCNGRFVSVSPIPRGRHAADALLDAARLVGAAGPGAPAPLLPLPQAVMERGRSIASRFGTRIAVIHPGSGSPKKNWPLERFVRLASELDAMGFGPVFLCGPAEAGIAAGHNMLADYPIVSGLALRDVAGFLASAALYVGNDSGITHLASAVGAPTVAVFGPTDPSVWGPVGSNVRVVRGEGAGHVLETVGVGMVLDAVRGMLERESERGKR